MAIERLPIVFADGSLSYCQATASDKPPWRIEFAIDEIGVIERSGDDLFDCLREIAGELRTHGARICCNGMRRDVRPSPMARESGGAKFVYQFKIGEPADPRSVLPLLGEAPCESTVSPEEQDAFYERWVSSVGRSGE